MDRPKFYEGQTFSHPVNEVSNPDYQLNSLQYEIHQNLGHIGSEIAAFYLDALKILYNGNNLQTKASLLGHLAKEIDSSLKHLLPAKEDVKKISKFLSEKNFGFVPPCILAAVALDINNLRSSKPLTDKDKTRIENRIRKQNLNRPEYISSILTTLQLDIDKLPSTDVAKRVDIAIRWIDASTRFNDFDHKHGVGKSPRPLEEFLPLWESFEGVLADLVGGYINFFQIINQILEHKVPTAEIKDSLPNMIKPDPLEAGPRYRYFFERLEHLGWFEPLNDIGYFNPKYNPPPQEDPDQPGYHYTPFWHAMEYLEKIANHTKNRRSNRRIETLVEIINAIIDYTDKNGERVENNRTDWKTIKIITTFPIEKIQTRHVKFISVALNSEWSNTLIDSEIGNTVLPALLSGRSKKLTLKLLKVIFDAKVSNREITSVMETYWLEDALKQHKEAIAKLCGMEAIRIAVAHIRDLIDQGAYSFDFIQQIDNNITEKSNESYAELLVNFISSLFQFNEPDNIAETVKTLLQESHTILRRIAVTAVTHHYEDLKQLFWGWQGNPLENISLKPELYQLIKTNSPKFEESEINQILRWIKSTQYNVSTEDAETQAKVMAYRKREWLSALLETSNHNVVSAYKEYEQINSAEINHPGLLWWTETSWGEVTPVTAEALSDMSNIQIAEYLAEFDEDNISLSSPTERGLAETLEKCVTMDPQRFANDLQIYQDIGTLYQHSILSGFLEAWRDQKKFDWTALLEFSHQILSLEKFWSEQDITGLNYKDWIVAVITDLIIDGTKDDDHAFNIQLLPLAEQILLILEEKVESDDPIIATRNGIRSIELSATFFNSIKCKIFTAMIDYALRCARVSNIKQGRRWSPKIKEIFTRKMNKEHESFVGVSFAFGAYLPYLLHLDEAWVIENIDRIFPQEDEFHWYITFMGYLYYSNTVYERLYLLLKERGYYQKVLNTDFVKLADEVLVSGIAQQLVGHIYVGWIIEEWETLDDETSLIYQLINSDKPDLLYALVHFFWNHREHLSEKEQTKIRLAWRAMFEVFSAKSDLIGYEKVLSHLSGWLDIVDNIDTEVLEWVKLSAKYLNKISDSPFFLTALRKHVSEAPAEVANIYIEILDSGIYPDYDQADIKEILRVISDTEHKEEARQICNLYAKAGHLFLETFYNEHLR